MEIRPVTIEDAEQLLAIYAPYVRETAITFEYEVPTLGEFRERIRTISSILPYLVAVEGEEILGYAYAGKFKCAERPEEQELVLHCIAHWRLL